MKLRISSLRTKFIIRMLTVLMIITIISGSLQLYFINMQVKHELETWSTIIVHGINAYFEAQESYGFTDEVGLNFWIQKMERDHTFIHDITVIDLKEFQNTDLEKQNAPPLGFLSEEDIEMIKKLGEKGKEKSIQKINGEKVLKLYLQVENGQVIYISMDYNKVTGQIYRHSIILVISSFVSLIVLSIMTIKFFDKIYENIKKIIKQIRIFETGDLTVKSQVLNAGELSSLSVTANIMVDNINKFIKDTQEQAIKTQVLSEELESEASDSLERIYELSTEITIDAREQLDEINDYLKKAEMTLIAYNHDENVQDILESMGKMRERANQYTAATTNITITLSDLLQSLYEQSRELSFISNTMLERMSNFKL